MKYLFAFLFITLSTNSVAMTDLYPFNNPHEQQRFQTLTHEIRCMVCQNQSIADSDATLAKDLRRKVYELVQQHRSDAEIKQFLVDRYGQFILFSPPVKPVTWALWGFPVFMLVLITGLLTLGREHANRTRTPTT